MGESDCILAVKRHATSKINKEEDLFEIKTMGFRGEALSAISSVSKLELNTCNDEQRGGFCLRLDGGIVIDQQKIGFPKGTKIIIEDLFFNTPARLKFLKNSKKCGQIPKIF